MTYFLLLLNWKVNIDARLCSGPCYFGLMVTHALRDSLGVPFTWEGGRLLCTVQNSVLSTWQGLYWWMQSAPKFHMSSFRMKKLLNIIHVWWNTANPMSNGKGKPHRAVTSTQTFSCKEERWIAEMNDSKYLQELWIVFLVALCDNVTASRYTLPPLPGLQSKHGLWKAVPFYTLTPWYLHSLLIVCSHLPLASVEVPAESCAIC